MRGISRAYELVYTLVVYTTVFCGGGVFLLLASGYQYWCSFSSRSIGLGRSKSVSTPLMSLSWQKSGYRSEVSAPTYMRTQARLQPAISNQIGRPRTSMHRSKPSNTIISSQNQYSSQSQWDSQSFPLSQRSGSESQSLLKPVAKVF